jgi:hypothetical protein
MKNKRNTSLSGTVPKSNRKTIETEEEILYMYFTYIVFKRSRGGEERNMGYLIKKRHLLVSCHY